MPAAVVIALGSVRPPQQEGTQGGPVDQLHGIGGEWATVTPPGDDSPGP